jgi:hypothetical protein
MLKGIRVSSKEELAERIYQYFDEVNERSRCVSLEKQNE